MEARFSLDPHPDEVASARRFVHQTLADWDGVHDHTAVTLMATELVTNALVHGAPPIGVTVRLHPPVVSVEVTDASPEPPRLLDVDPGRQFGKGLRVVDTLADDWGFETLARGKVVWFSLSTE